MLFLVLPAVLGLLSVSLESQLSFALFKQFIGHPLTKIVLLGVLWAYLHHFCAGIRHLAMDLHLGLELEAARASSYAVLGVSITATLLIGVTLW